MPDRPTVPDDLLVHEPHPADVAPATRAGELAVVVRNGVVESRHLGHAAVVAPDGTLAATVGDASTTFFPRSSVKPWQAATVRRLGARHDGQPLDGAALAIAAGSHDATARHRELVTAMLVGGGLGPGALQCPPAALPEDPSAARTPLAYNCSGKHTGMLLACRANGWELDGYLDPDHPLQQAIRQDLETAVGVAVAATAVDGCGAPLYAVPLDGLAAAAARYLRGDEHRRAVGVAMRRHPWAVAGPGSEDTVVMEADTTLVAKFGADGVQVVMTDDGWAVVVKVLDGGRRAAMTAGLALLAHASGRGLADARSASREAVLGHGQPVGAVLAGADVAT